MFKKNNLNILIPMAGEGSRFQQAGYRLPKPLININGKPMIEVVVNSLGIDANYIYLVRKEHYEKYDVQGTLNRITPNCKIVLVDKLTQGAACTTLLAKDLINNESELIIANSDQYIEWSPQHFFSLLKRGNFDGAILTFFNDHPKWSYAKLNEKGFVCEVAEKKQISNLATVGVYWWKTGFDYVNAAEQMISKNIKTNNEFYVCPVFNEVVEAKAVISYDVKTMMGLGTPEDLEIFLRRE